jgi:hypothetical protein
MRLGRQLGVVAAALVATAFGCGENKSVRTKTGDLRVLVATSPADVASIHVAVTGADFTGSIDTDLVKQPDQSWSGTVLDVPPGLGRTVTADAFDASHKQTFAGVASDVEVTAGELTDVAITLKPVSDDGPGVNTPPAFTDLSYPSAILSTETASLSAEAADPDAGAELTYTWSVIQGGGTFSSETNPDLIPGVAASTVYTPVEGFTGYAVIQVSVSDGIATTTTAFPIAIGGGVFARITFDTPPDLTIVSVQRQSLMPGDTSQIQYTLTNPVQPWTPATMHVHTSWSDTCGGTFDAAPEDLDINQGDTATRTVTYTASASRPASVTDCNLAFTVVDTAGVQMTSTINVWVLPPMVMFQSSVPVAGNAFGGSPSAADAFCQSLADAPTAVVPPGTYRALVSFDQISAKNRLIDAPYIRVDGTPIARNKAELFSINLLNAIRTNENNTFNGVAAVYTGTNGDGSKGTNCNNWTSADGGDTATAGINATAASPNWTNSGTFTCSAQLTIYCVQQPIPL